MAFHSIAFLFGFLPVCLLAYFLLPARFREGRNGLLLAFSLLFYAWGGLWLLPLFLAVCLGVWAGGLLIAPGGGGRGVVSGRAAGSAVFLTLSPGGRKRLFAALTAALIAVLAVFKYTAFLLDNLRALGLDAPAPAVAMPAGVSFFVFQAVSYLADVYRGTIPAERRLGRLTLYMAFFPQLLQGPIVRYGDFEPRLAQRRETVSEASAGAVRFCFGLAKKVLLADALGAVANGAYGSGDRLTVGLAWIGSIAYSLQLYFDFSGYTDMALGLGQMFGLSLPENFNYPYIAQSAGEFWRRWHITLSQWFRDYVYIPLGGSRCSAGRRLRNLLAVWLLTGLWHGSAWTFVLWGLYYAAFLIGEKFLWGRTLERLPRPVRHLYALLLINFGWVLFRAGTLRQAGAMLSAMLGFAPGGLWSGEGEYYIRQYAWEWLIAIPAALPVKVWLENALNKRVRSGGRLAEAVRIWGPKLLAGGLLGLSAVRLLGSTARSFLYFQF